MMVNLYNKKSMYYRLKNRTDPNGTMNQDNIEKWLTSQSNAEYGKPDAALFLNCFGGVPSVEYNDDGQFTMKVRGLSPETNILVFAMDNHTFDNIQKYIKPSDDRMILAGLLFDDLPKNLSPYRDLILNDIPVIKTNTDKNGKMEFTLETPQGFRTNSDMYFAVYVYRE